MKENLAFYKNSLSLKKPRIPHLAFNKSPSYFCGAVKESVLSKKATYMTKEDRNRNKL